MSTTLRNMLAQLSSFSVGTLPFQYLGCPIFQGKPKCIHFQPIVDRIKVKLATWKGVLLSIMGRVQLVKSIVHGMLVYSFHIYRWPTRLLHRLDRWIKKFVWSGDIYTRKICTISWKNVCRPSKAGGLDLKSTQDINASLLLHLSWKLFTQDSQCFLLFQKRFLSYGLPRSHYFKSSIWPGVKEYLSTVLESSVWIIGNGENIDLWLDNWMGATLVSILQSPPSMYPHLKTKVHSVIDNGRWQLLPSLLNYPTVAESILKITLPVTPLLDTRVWTHASNDILIAKLAFQFLNPSPNKIDWASIIWRACIPPSHSFVFWRLMLYKLPTDENLQRRRCTLVSICGLCYKQAETSPHLFLSCDFVLAVWHCIGLKLNRTLSLDSILSLLSCVPTCCSSQVRDVYVAAIVHSVYCIWLSRNALRFSFVPPSLHATMARVSSFVAMSGMHSNDNCLTYDVAVLNSFFIPPNYRHFKDIISVVWKPPTITWVKVNMDDSVIDNNASCGGLFRDFRGTFLGYFASNVGHVSVLEAELLCLILAMEFAASNHWTRLWIECDSSSVVHTFKNPSVIPISLRNRWHNCMHHGMTVLCSHIFREGNCCADMLPFIGHSLTHTIWFDTMPPSLAVDFARDRSGLPNYCFP